MSSKMLNKTTTSRHLSALPTLHCLNEGNTTKDKIVKKEQQKEKINIFLFCFSSSLEYHTLFFIDQNVLYEFVLRHE